MEPLPVILVTGFLGSGKTTFLQNLAKSRPDLKLLFLVNEFADSDVDAVTLKRTGLPVGSVVGGSLFCECKAGEFVKLMQTRILQLHQDQQLDAVVIETSGIADPEAIGRLMRDHGLDAHFSVRRIITIVSPMRFDKLIKNLPVVTAQIRTSDLVIINKTDLSDAETVKSVEQSIRALNPHADIEQARYCAVSFSLENHILALPDSPLSTCDANPFSVLDVEVPPSQTLVGLRSWLEQLPPEILRVKGHVFLEDQFWSVERTVDSLDILPCAEKGSSRLVLIAHDRDEAILQASASG